MEFSVTSVVENLFVQRVRLGREGGVVGSTLLDDSSKRVKGTRSTTDVPRLTADRRRTKTLNRGRWRVVALEWGGKGGGGRNDRSTYVALRGGRCLRDPMDTGNRWEYTRREYIQGESFRCARRNELKKSFLQFFLFLQKSCSRVGLFLSWTLRI